MAICTKYISIFNSVKPSLSLVKPNLSLACLTPVELVARIIIFERAFNAANEDVIDNQWELRLKYHRGLRASYVIQKLEGEHGGTIT